MEGPISFWGYKEQESNLILPERDDDDDIHVVEVLHVSAFRVLSYFYLWSTSLRLAEKGQNM